VEADTDGDGLTAHVAGERVRPAVLRAHCFARLQEWPAAIVPDRFVVSGPGADDRLFDAAHPMAPLLQKALELTNPGTRWEGAACYLAAGGRLGRIDAFLEALAELGATGLEFADLSGPVPPAELLGKLCPRYP
jgi:hypothetical protein